MAKKRNSRNRHPGGRPSKFKNIDLSEVSHYTENGYTDKELADVFDVTKQTINNWKKKFPEFFDSLKEGKLIADAKVVASLFQRACGYSHPDIHISNFQGKIAKTNIIKHYPPDTTAAIFWLKNRQPEEWREKKEADAVPGGISIFIQNIILKAGIDGQETKTPKSNTEVKSRLN